MQDEIQDEYALTGMQQSLLLASVTSRSHDPYIQSAVVKLDEPLDGQKVLAAWQATIDAFDVLRTSFHWGDGRSEPLQRVHRRVEAELLEFDWRDVDAQELSQRTQQLVDQQIAARFELDRPQLVRFTVIHTGEETSQVVWTFHHLILDGRSVARVLDATISAYRSLREHEQPRIASGPQFCEHARWLAEQDFSISVDYWREQFEGFGPHRVSLPRRSTIGALCGDEKLVRFHRVTDSLTPEETKQLGRVADSLYLTPLTVLQAAWALILGQATGRADVAFAATRAARKSVRRANSIAGLLMTVVPFRVRWDEDQSTGDWLRDLCKQWREIRRHEHTPSAIIRQAIDLPGGDALSNTIVSYESAHLSDILRSPDDKPMDIRFQLATDHDVAVYAYAGERLSMEVVVSSESGDTTTAARLMERLKSTTIAIVTNVDGTVGEVMEQIAAPAELQALKESNITARSRDEQALVHEHVESAAARHPNSIAVIARDATLSYRQLNERANKLGRELRESGLKPGDSAGILCERISDLVVAMLAVLKCGGCFVPLDPSQPSQRLASMLRDSDAALLITQQALLSRLPVTAANILIIEQHAEAIEARDSQNLDATVAPEQLAYTMFTSGSTGRPKGVDVSHGALVNLIEDAIETPGVSVDDCVIAATTVSFDPAMLQVFLPLSVGARLVVADEDAVYGGEALASCIAENQGTYLMTTPVILRSLRDCNWEGQPGLCLSYIGEPLSADLAAWLLPRVGSLWNTYGPTEATIYCTSQAIIAPDDVAYIGRAIGNTISVVLDHDLRAVPAGVVGELFIGGSCLAEGYRNAPELTAERFVEHPLAADGGGRLYRTGDLARWTTDGVLEYLGREDTQVKIYGVRIELSEIQAAMERHSAVSQAVVLIDDTTGSSPILAAYVVPVDQLSTSQQSDLRIDLRQHLLEILPPAMHPRQIAFLEKIPRTPNGKLDRRALPAAAIHESSVTSIAPRTPTEGVLHSIFAELLPELSIGVNCNLLDTGVDSLIVFQAVGKAKSAGLNVGPRDIFDHPTIALLAAYVDRQRQDEPAAMSR